MPNNPFEYLFRDTEIVDPLSQDQQEYNLNMSQRISAQNAIQGARGLNMNTNGQPIVYLDLDLAQATQEATGNLAVEQAQPQAADPPTSETGKLKLLLRMGPVRGTENFRLCSNRGRKYTYIVRDSDGQILCLIDDKFVRLAREYTVNAHKIIIEDFAKKINRKLIWVSFKDRTAIHIDRISAIRPNWKLDGESQTYNAGQGQESFGLGSDDVNISNVCNDQNCPIHYPQRGRWSPPRTSSL